MKHSCGGELELESFSGTYDLLVPDIWKCNACGEIKHVLVLDPEDLETIISMAKAGRRHNIDVSEIKNDLKRIADKL